MKWSNSADTAFIVLCVVTSIFVLILACEHVFAISTAVKTLAG